MNHECDKNTNIDLKKKSTFQPSLNKDKRTTTKVRWDLNSKWMKSLSTDQLHASVCDGSWMAECEQRAADYVSLTPPRPSSVTVSPTPEHVRPAPSCRLGVSTPARPDRSFYSVRTLY